MQSREVEWILDLQWIMKMQIAERLSKLLEEMGKRVQVSYF